MTPNPISLDQLEWERTCPEAITSDTIWTLDAYRSSLYLLDLARADIRDAVKRGLSPEIASQLLRSVTSVSANLAEGYSRSTRGDRLRFYGYALGSLRECMSWYRAASDFLAADSTAHRLNVVSRIRRLLLGLIRSTRARSSSRHDFEP